MAFTSIQPIIQLFTFEEALYKSLPQKCNAKVRMHLFAFKRGFWIIEFKIRMLQGVILFLGGIRGSQTF